MQSFMRNASALSHQSLLNFVISCEYANMSTLASTINALLEDAIFYTYRVEKIISKGKRDAEHALLVENVIQ
jgi:hypothetical protein